MTPTKRLLLAILLAAITIGIATAIYFVFFRVPLIPPPAPGEAPAPVTGLPAAAPGTPGAPGETPPVPPSTLPLIPDVASGGPTKTTLLTEGPITGAILSADGKTVSYYNRDDGKFYRVGPDGSANKLSAKQFFDVQNVTWSPDANRAILEYPDGANIVFNFDSEIQTTLPKHWEDFDFSPTGSEIVAKSIGLNPNNRWLITSAPDGSRATSIAPLGENEKKVTASWSPSGEALAFSATGSAQGLDASEVLLIGKNNENFKSLIVEGRDFRPLWSPDGERILYSAYNEGTGFRPLLWIVDGRGDAIGANRRSLGLGTWADKCAYADAVNVYCAVPTEIPEGYGLQPRLRDQLNDQVFRVNVATGTKTLIGAPVEGAAMLNLQVATDGSVLYYTDARTNELRMMRLR